MCYMTGYYKPEKEKSSFYAGRMDNHFLGNLRPESSPYPYPTLRYYVLTERVQMKDIYLFPEYTIYSLQKYLLSTSMLFLRFS